MKLRNIGCADILETVDNHVPRIVSRNTIKQFCKVAAHKTSLGKGEHMPRPMVGNW